MKIASIMTTDVTIISPDESIQSATNKMEALDCGFLPVGENDKLVGTITDRDIALRAVGKGKAPDCRVGDVMSTDIKYCYEDQEVSEVSANMGEQQVRRLPVVNRDKRLVGIVSIGDLSQVALREDIGAALRKISGSAQTRH
jgi:CBS domain-containing protein